MTRFPLRSWRSRSATIALIGATLLAPLAASPALADGWEHGPGESRLAASHRDRDRHDWRRPAIVVRAPVYAVPAYAAPAYPPPRIVYAPAPGYGAAPPAAYYPPAPIPARAIACASGTVAGGLIGAAGGGIIGSQFGRSSGNAAATVAGILGGAALGASVGQAASGCY